MSSTLTNKIVKSIKISAIVLSSMLLLIFALPYLFPHAVSNKIKQWANGSINGQLQFSGTGLSFFKHFPNLTLTLYDLSLKGSAPFQNDTLVAAKEVSFGIDLRSVFSEKVTINKIFLNHAYINIQTDTAGRVNYNVYRSKPANPASEKDTSSASLGINQILIEDSRVVYNDRSLPMQFIARGFNYTGKGDLSRDVFDLYTHTEMASVDFSYNNRPYVLGKKVNADLITKINTRSLAFVFQKNDLLINQLPVQFIGKFGFLKNGYDMDFKVSSHESNLHDMITALPAAYVKMLAGTDVNGIGNLQLELKGKYNAADSTMPDLNLKVNIRNGYINNKKSAAPISNLYLNFETRLPGLDPDSLQVNLDSIYFNIGKDYFGSVIRLKGVKQPDIYARINTEIDLEKWNRAFGIKTVDLKGRYALHLLAKGKYSTGIKRSGIRKIDTVITSIPQFTVRSTFSNGYIRYAGVPQALQNISFNLNAGCPDNNYRNATLSLENLNATALDNFIKGYFKVSAAPGYPMNASLQAKVNLADLKKIYPLQGMALSGNLVANLQTKGRYLPKKHIYPVTKANISLSNGLIQTKYYPHAIQQIQINTQISNNSGSLHGLSVVIKPVSFMFEDKPFLLTAYLKNFNNLDYNIQSAGTLDIGKIYQVFAVKDYNVNGFITTRLSLKGRQSDALAGRYDKLANSGSMTVKNIALTSDLFPKPFLIKSGNFSFNQDKMKFEAFKATYGKSVIILNGALSNVIGYATKAADTLHGSFNLGSASIIADDFMAYASNSPAQTGKTGQGPSGVIMVPKNLNLDFTADVKKVKYNGLELGEVKGGFSVNNGNIILKQTGFNLIGAPVTMDAVYNSLSPQKATFQYHINAQNFDIKKAYHQIKLFRDLATSAKNTEGLVSLDYKLAGRLNSNMQPVYPSLTGGGILSVKKVRLNGFRLFGAVGNRTNHKGIDSGDVSKVNIETSIARNVITIKQTKIRMAGFRLKFDGQVSFDNALNLHFRLGLPPLGIFGIPMTITGTETKPIIHLGKGKQEDELKETDDDGS
jgi:AsmA protein